MKAMLVSGATGGIGAVIMQEFASSGYTVFATDSRRPTTVPDNVIFIQSNLADSTSIDELVAQIKKQTSSLELLVNCAAVQDVGAITALPEDAWDETFAVNVRAPWLLMKNLHGLLRQSAVESRPACVVNISSVHEIATSPGMSAYAASKSALGSLTRSASIEFAKDGIRVNSIVPGAVNTPMLLDHLSPEKVTQLLSRQLIPSLVDPSAVADTVKYFASPAAASMTGQQIVLDSGVFAQLATETG